MSGKVVVFHGADHKAGTTMIAQSVAEHAALTNKGLKVLLLFLEGKPAGDYFCGAAGSLDDIKNDIDSRLVTCDEIASRCLVRRNLSIMGGIGVYGAARHYFPENADEILSKVRDAYDLVVVDSGCEIDCGIAIGALNQKAQKILVIAQEETSVRRYERLCPLYKRLSISFGMIVLNKFENKDPISTAYLGERLGIKNEAILPVAQTRGGRTAEMTKMTLMRCGSPTFRGDIARLADHVLHVSGIIAAGGSNFKGKKWSSFF